RSMGDRINEEQRITRFEMTFDGADDAVHGRLLVALLDRDGLRMPQVGLVAAGDDHGRAVARPDVVEGHEDVDLAAMELAGVVAELRADRPDVSARMEPLRAARAADRAEALVDEGRPAVPGALLRVVGAEQMAGLAVPA